MALTAKPLVCSLVALLASSATPDGSAGGTESPPADGNLPYLRLLSALQMSDDVLPPQLPRVPLYAMYNREAPIPPQCYTRTEGKHNPCYVCHQDAVPARENVMNDRDLQAEYSFSETGLTNHWLNLFKDRSTQVAQISDAEILEWINQDNYSELAPRLKAAGFAGWMPDLKDLQRGRAAFDAQGFARDGSGWVAFNYKPLPSTFWPTNGSTDDVMIRLPAPFRQDDAGRESRDVYLANLTLLENNIKQGKGTREHYFGAAGAVKVVPFVYPQGTEFLHTVRYVGIDAHGDIVNSTRMKEVRYMQRWLESDPARLRVAYEAEQAEKEKGELPAYVNFGHRGLGGAMGWQISGFIEDRNGRLRVNTFEETMFCMGCHNSIGSTIDKTFSFARKVDGPRGWGYINLKGMPDAPNMGESKGEIATYLERVGGGSEFRSNAEMQARWYRPDGSLNTEAVLRARDVYELITPSVERALQLNKAYRVIVAEQSYLFGRDPIVAPPQNVYRLVDRRSSPTLPEHLQYKWDIRLDWRTGSRL